MKTLIIFLSIIILLTLIFIFNFVIIIQITKKEIKIYKVISITPLGTYMKLLKTFKLKK